jgi:hypothetical protein
MIEGCILSLFDYTGQWSDPWREAGFTVHQIDIKHGHDIRKIGRDFLDSICPVYGVLSAPPCTDFASSGARWFAIKDARGDTRSSIRLVTKTLAIIRYLRPVFWVLENPVGRIASCVLHLPQECSFSFDPYQYAKLADDPDSDQYTKRTNLWGDFISPTSNVLGRDYSLPPIHGSKLHRLPPSPERQSLRSVTPQGFSRAFYMANRPEVQRAQRLTQVSMLFEGVTGG